MIDFDVIVAGGGPAGSTAATLLAQHGHRVLVIDRDKHPRFHIGESMLPMSEPVFKRLGIAWKAGEYLPKDGAEFINEALGCSIRFPLSGIHQPYQVERAKFDQMMLKNAESKGAAVHQQETVKDVKVGDESVRVVTNVAEYNSRYLIDATGRSAMMGRRHGAIKRIDSLGRFSLYTHYRDIASPESGPWFATGDVRIMLVDIGWLWVIPLTGRRLSIGLVVQKEVPAGDYGPELFERYLAASPMLTAALAGAVREFDIKAEADFSFTNSVRHGRRYACCGDAAGFIDPVFSSGVFFAVKTAEAVADRLHKALADGSEGEEGIHAVDDDDYLIGFNTIRMFVELFYHSGLVQSVFFYVDRSERIKEDILGILAGDLWAGTNDFQKKLLASRRLNKGPVRVG